MVTKVVHFTRFFSVNNKDNTYSDITEYSYSNRFLVGTFLPDAPGSKRRECIRVDNRSVVCPSLEPWVDCLTMNICWPTTLGSIAAAGGSLLASM